MGVTVAGMSLAAIAVSVAGSPATLSDWIPWRCPLRACTGIECPACGSGASLLALASGDWRGAFAAHPIAPLLPGIAAIAFTTGWRWPQKTAAVRQAIQDRRITAAVAIAIAIAIAWIAWIAFGLVR